LRNGRNIVGEHTYRKVFCVVNETETGAKMNELTTRKM
jgi:hypothetical protein